MICKKVIENTRNSLTLNCPTGKFSPNMYMILFHKKGPPQDFIKNILLTPSHLCMIFRVECDENCKLAHLVLGHLPVVYHNWQIPERQFQLESLGAYLPYDYSSVSIIRLGRLRLSGLDRPGLTVSTTPLRKWGFLQCLPFCWTTLRSKHCGHPIAVMGVVDILRLCSITLQGTLCCFKV